MGLALAGIGTALPTHSISQDEAARLAKVVCCSNAQQTALLPALYRYTDIATRHFVLGEAVVRDVLSGEALSASEFLPKGAPDERGPSTGRRMDHYRREALPLAIRAGGRALEHAGCLPKQVTHLITISCTGFSAPGVDTGLICGLGLPPTVARTHIGFMGCHGAINGLRVAQAFVRAETSAVVLLCAVELCSLHFYYGWDPEKVVANALFADGAAALVGIEPRAGPRSVWEVAATGSYLLPDSEDAMAWRIGDHGFEMTLSPRIPGLINQRLRPWLAEWLRLQGYSLEHVHTWALHPGGPRILGAVEKALGLPAEASAASRAILRECGNMSSPTLLFILERLLNAGEATPCVALAFGPGLVVEAALLL